VTASGVELAAERTERPVSLGRWEQLALLPVFTAAIFVGAALVFGIQPMAARMVLPLFGGSQAVWTTSMLFFQAVLLAGYGFAHLSNRWLGPGRQWIAQVPALLIALATLPIGQHLTAPPAAGAPAIWLLGVLAVSIGAPFFVVTTASPVLQRWFSLTNHRAARDPYFLYAAGNVGSLLALIAYPLVVEPRLTLADQARLWSLGYLAFVALMLVCLVVLRKSAPGSSAQPRAAAAPLAWRVRLRWILMAFVPSSLMLGATTYISTDIASAPLLWVAPLAIYLITFIVAFARRPPVTVRLASLVLPLLTTPLLLTLLSPAILPMPAALALHLVTLLCAGILVHGRLAKERPEPARLTEFYVLLSVGGVLGGVFNALLAPVLFDSVLEYPLVLVLALLLRPGRIRAPRPATLVGRTADILLAPVPLLGCLIGLALVAGDAESGSGGSTDLKLILILSVASLLIFALRPRRYAFAFAALGALLALAQPGLHAERTFFGVLHVSETDSGEHVLTHGTTLHGRQSFEPGRTGEPLSYYARTGPIGDVFDAYQREAQFRRVGVIGLGVGSLAAYGRPGQSFAFYEIDPAVIEIASNPRLFTFLRDTRAKVELVVGDGRRSLAGSAGGDDLLVVDAFSSDAIPVHLLTREAVELYLAKLRPKGLVAFHVSNRHLRLAPVVGAVAASLGLVAVERVATVSRQELDAGKTPSHWIVLAHTQARLVPLLDREGWRPLQVSPGSREWTDDFSNVLSVIDWSR